jgi:hypothetical protein
VSITDANTGTVVGVDGVILRTTDGGTTWTSQTSGTTKWLWGVCFTEANSGSAVGFEGTILHTTNGGATWTSQTSGTANNINGVSFTDENTGTVVGFGGTILRTTTGGVVSVPEDHDLSEVPRQHHLEQSHPNPASEASTISFTVTTAGMVSIEVFDASSKIVAVLVHQSMQPGSYETTFDTGSVASGVYYYRMQTGDVVETKKLVVVR